MKKYLSSLSFCISIGFIHGSETLIKVNNSYDIRRSLESNNLAINLILQKKYGPIKKAKVIVSMEEPKIYKIDKVVAQRKQWLNFFKKQKKYSQLSFWLINIRNLYNDLNTFMNTVFNGRYGKFIKLILITALCCFLLQLISIKFLNKHFWLRAQNLKNIEKMSGVNDNIDNTITKIFNQYKSNKNPELISAIEEHINQ